MRNFFLFPDTISFFSLFIRVKEGRGVLGVLRKLIIRGKKIFLNYKDKQYLPPLQILSSYRRKELLSLNMAPIKFRANFDGEIEFIHSELKHSKEIVYEGDEIYLPHLSEGELKLILTTRGEFSLSKVEKFHIVDSLKDANIKSEKNELNLYTITKTSIFNVSENLIKDLIKVNFCQLII